MSLSTLIRWGGPARAWAVAFLSCAAVDALLGRWMLLPVFVVGFYGGTMVISSLVLPFLERWRAWLRPRGVRIWYLAEMVMWTGITLALCLLAPWWLSWDWEATLSLQAVGALMLAVSVGVGAWACRSMGWARLLFAPVVFPPGTESEDHVPERLVVKGPYRHVRNPLYATDVGLIWGTALLTHNWGVVVMAFAYLGQLGMQLHFEERELKSRFGEPYLRYCRLVPRFVPRFRPVDPARVYGRPEQALIVATRVEPLRRVNTFERTVNQGVVDVDVYGTNARVHPSQDRHGQIATRR